MTVTIQKGVARGSVSAPPSKSMGHRLLICAALAEVIIMYTIVVAGIIYSVNLSIFSLPTSIARRVKIRITEAQMTGEIFRDSPTELVTAFACIILPIVKDKIRHKMA